MIVLKAMKIKVFAISLFLITFSLPIYCESDSPAPQQAPKTWLKREAKPAPAAPSTAPLPTIENKKDEQVLKLVKEAEAFVEENGEALAIQEFSKKDGRFTRGYFCVIAMDFLGITLANPFDAELVGKSQLDLLADKKFVNREMIAKAKFGGGWVVTRWNNPESKKLECRKAFVTPIGKKVFTHQYLLGCGYFYPLTPRPKEDCSEPQ